MTTVELGKTGIQVSEICMGAMYLGTKTDSSTSFDLLDCYVEAGGAFIDTANIYSFWVPGFTGGESELLLGEWMRVRKNRSHLFLATKVGFAYPGTAKGLAAQVIINECEKSLKRLGTGTIDLFYAHVDEPETPQEESLEAFHRLTTTGKVRFIGASNYTAARLTSAVDASRRNAWTGYCCIQQRHTFMPPIPGASFGPQLAVDNDLLNVCRTQGMTLLAYSPLLGGAYSRGYSDLPEQYRGTGAKARFDKLCKTAHELGVSVNQLVLAWLMRGDPPAIPLVAASRVEHLKEDFAAAEVRLTPQQEARLRGDTFTEQ